MSSREYEPIAIRPVWILRIVLEKGIPQRVGHGGCSHGHAGVTRVCVLHGIRGEHPDGIDAEIFQRLRLSRRGDLLSGRHALQISRNRKRFVTAAGDLEDDPVENTPTLGLDAVLKACRRNWYRAHGLIFKWGVLLWRPQQGARALKKGLDVTIKSRYY